MPVYVDCSKNRLGRLVMSHMLADTPDELHAMADRIGVARRWFQPASSPHYDVCQQKRALAIAAGAAVVDRRETVEVLKRIRANPSIDWSPWV